METSFDCIGLGKRICERREALHMTQEGLCEQVGVGAREMDDIERGAQNISVEMLVKIALALDACVGELLVDTFGQDEVCYEFPEPGNHFAVIRRALDRLEFEMSYIR